jgi:hypothetical protein
MERTKRRLGSEVDARRRENRTGVHFPLMRTRNAGKLLGLAQARGLKPFDRPTPQMGSAAV